MDYPTCRLNRSTLRCLANSRSHRSVHSQLPQCPPSSQFHGQTVYRRIRRNPDLECRSPASTRMRAAPPPTRRQRILGLQVQRLDVLAPMHRILPVSFSLHLHRARILCSAQVQQVRRTHSPALSRLRTATRTGGAMIWKRPSRHSPVDSSKMASFLRPRASTPSGVLAASPTCYRVL